MCVPRWNVQDHLSVMQRMWCWLSSPQHASEILFDWRHQTSFWTDLLHPLAFTSCNVMGVSNTAILTSASETTCGSSLFCSNSSKGVLCIDLPLSFTQLFCVCRTRHMPSSSTNAHTPTLRPEPRGILCNFLVVRECGSIGYSTTDVVKDTLKQTRTLAPPVTLVSPLQAARCPGGERV